MGAERGEHAQCGEHDAGDGEPELDGVDPGRLAEAVDDRHQDDEADVEEDRNRQHERGCGQRRRDALRSEQRGEAALGDGERDVVDRGGLGSGVALGDAREGDLGHGSVPEEFLESEDAFDDEGSGQGDGDQHGGHGRDRGIEVVLHVAHDRERQGRGAAVDQEDRHGGVVEGDDEAEGIAAGLATDPAIAAQPDFWACDLGGGSLELIAVEGRKVSAKTSLPLGAIRLTESYINNSGECVSANEIEAIDHYVQDTLFASEFPFPSEVDTLVATGGAFVSIRSILADREDASFEKRSLLFHEEIKSLLYEIAELTLRERIESLHPLSPNRADVMPAALACIVSLLNHVGARAVRNSLHNLRYGEAARMLGIVG